MSIAEQVATGTAGRSRPPSIEIVVPVHNEEAELEASILRLRWFLDTSFPFDATVTIADNASTDHTWSIAARLARRVPGVRAVHLAEKGRGRALRATWMASEATVVAYMDVDLATGLEALLPLVAPLVSGHSDVAIGTRLARGSRVVRGPKRELISRSYNLIVRAALHNGFSDAQCGFKAVRTDVARSLLPLVQDETWFFDTELLVLAERSGLRVHEVPVDWTDDPDSRVDLRRTAFDDLRGVWRMMRAPATPATPATPPAPMPSPWPPLAAQLAALLVATALAALVRFTILRAWVFRAHLRSVAARPDPRPIGGGRGAGDRPIATERPGRSGASVDQPAGYSGETRGQPGST
jgi:hypothetical protein